MNRFFRWLSCFELSGARFPLPSCKDGVKMQLPSLPHLLAALSTSTLLALSGCQAEQAGQIYINEFMPSNTATITDESGAYPDWIELYNASLDTVNLEGYYITDDLGNPTKSQLSSSLEIEAGGYLLLWVDGDTMDGTNHLPFNLAAEGEEIALYVYEEGVPVQMDAVSYGPMDSDISAAREYDGAETWTTTDAPTPGASNG